MPPYTHEVSLEILQGLQVSPALVCKTYPEDDDEAGMRHEALHARRGHRGQHVLRACIKQHMLLAGESGGAHGRWEASDVVPAVCGGPLVEEVHLLPPLVTPSPASLHDRDNAAH